MIGVDAAAANLARVRARIVEVGGELDRLTIVAVTKGFGPDLLSVARALDLTELGENYAAELLTKVADQRAVDLAPRWHFLGRLQTNKIRKVAPHVTMWQSVDRPEVVDEIARRAPGAQVLVQVNLSGEPHKGGVGFDEAATLVRRGDDQGLVVAGLMGVGTAGDDRGTRLGFDRLVALADDLDRPVRSIGMSGDLELAVAAGSTMVRIGRDIFGDRPPR